MNQYYKTYQSAAAYDADEDRKKLNASSISDVSGEIIADGVNVETINPDFGDAVYHDANKQVHFVKCGTVRRDLLPAGYVPVGVCGKRVGSKVYVIYKESQVKKFADFFRWKVTGWKLDGTAHSGAVRLHDKPCGDFSYTARTLEECASQLDTYVRAHGPEGRKYIAYMQDGCVILQLCTYNAWQGYLASISGLSVSYFTAQELPTAPSNYRRCGNIGNGIWNMAAAVRSFKNDQTNSAFNPQSPVSSEPSYPVCLPGYLGVSVNTKGQDNCKWLREKYGEGREGWEKYLEANLPLMPFPKGAQSDDYGTGFANTYAIAAQKYPNENGQLVEMYPASAYAASVGFDGVKQLEPGRWFGPAPKDFYYNFSELTYGGDGVSIETADPINRTLSAMGLPLLSVTTSSWLFSRPYDSRCWYAFGGGNVDNGCFCSGNRVVPLALYELCSE